MRYSDDGEPQGTGGQPMLNVFVREEVTNVCCVVTRYFGGILLGAGGLTRAYGGTAKLALNEAGISRMRLWATLAIPCAYSQYERVKLLVEGEGGIIADTDFAADVVLTVLLPAESDGCPSGEADGPLRRAGSSCWWRRRPFALVPGRRPAD